MATAYLIWQHARTALPICVGTCPACLCLTGSIDALTRWADNRQIMRALRAARG